MGGIILLKLEKLQLKISTEIKSINEELRSSPSGYLVKRGKFLYHIDGSTQKGITKNVDLIKDLCRKKYLLSRLSQLMKLSRGEKDSRTPYEIINSFSKAYKSVPIDYFYHRKTIAWMQREKRRNTLFLETAIYEYQAVLYRSLSERIVAEIIHESGFVFEYDLHYDLGYANVSPDFTIKNPFNDDTFLCEFYGAFNKSEYGQKMNDKFDAYAKIGFTDGENLLTLFEYHIRVPERIRELLSGLY